MQFEFLNSLLFQKYFFSTVNRVFCSRAFCLSKEFSFDFFVALQETLKTSGPSNLCDAEVATFSFSRCWQQRKSARQREYATESESE